MRAARYLIILIVSFAAMFQSCKPLDVPDTLLTVEVMRPASWTVTAVREGITLGTGEFVYDDDGKLISQTATVNYGDGTTIDKSITYSFTYNELNAVDRIVRKSESFDKDGDVVSTSSSATSYNYDESGLLIGTSFTYPGVYTASTTDYGYNADGTLSYFGSQSSPSSTFTWYQGNITRRSRDADNYTAYSYDDKNRCVQLREYRSGLTYLGYLQADFHYDEKGRLIRKSIRDEAGLFSNQYFTWELGESSFDILDVEQYNKYQHGVLTWNGVSY